MNKSNEKKLYLETYEWDNVWWEQARDNERRRVLYIGDSISCDIRQKATKQSGGKLLFDGYASSKALDNAYLKDAIRLFGRQQRYRDLVLFNNGLHGFHLGDDTEYKALYEDMVQFLLEEYQGATIVLVLSTSVKELSNDRVIARNDSVKEIAEKYGLPVIDLYTPSLEYADLHRDPIHFTEEGSEKLTERLLGDVMKLISEEADHVI